MSKTYILYSIFTLLFLFQFISFTHSQEMEAVYWFKKGVNEKNLDKKVEFYLKAINAKPDFIEAHYNLALTYVIQKHYEGAEESFKKALTLNPSSLNNSLTSNILNRLGSMYRKVGRYKEAEESFQAVLNITQDKKFKALTLYELGQTKIAQSQYDEAINYFRQGLIISPEDQVSFETGIQLAETQRQINDLYQQGMQLIQTQQLSQAADVFNQIIDINPNHLGAKVQLEKITTLLEQNQLMSNEQIQQFYNQAMAYMNSGDWSKAIQAFEKIKQIQPNYLEVNQLLAQAQKQQDQQSLLQQKIKNFYDMGVENFNKGNFTIALINFERVAELDPNYQDVSSQILATKKEMDRINGQTAKLLQSEEIAFMETEDDFQFDLNKQNDMMATNLATKQLFSEKSRELDAAIDSQLVYKFYQEALDLMEKQDWKHASILLEKIKLIKPDYMNTEFLFSQVKQNIEMAERSVLDEDSSTMKSKSPGIFIAAFLAGIIILPLGVLFASPTTRAKYYILQKKYGKAREIYERMLAKKPNNIKLYITLANIYINENRVDEVAIRVFERAIQYNDNLKIQLEPIVMRYYLQKSKSADDTPKKLLTGKLKEELKKMGND